jgi:reactive chlorine resistance protein C
MTRLVSLQSLLSHAGAAILRYSLVLIFLGYGVLKFTHEEAAAIAPLTEHSLLMFWLNPLFGVDGASALIGVVEIVVATLIALRRPFPALSALGSGVAAFALLNTVSFAFTTPGLALTSIDAGFLLKDVTLLGAALWTAAEALAAIAPSSAVPARA